MLELDGSSMDEVKQMTDFPLFKFIDLFVLPFGPYLVVLMGYS